MTEMFFNHSRAHGHRGNGHFNARCVVRIAYRYAKGGMTFKPCAGCPSVAKCKSMGQCMKKSGAGKKPMGYAKGGMVQKMPKAC